MISPTKITRAEFDKALGRYPALIKSISEQKAGKSPARGEKAATSLAELDEIRFEKLPNKYSKDVTSKPKNSLSKEDLIELITWKLKHGTFRPALMNLAKGNTDEEIEKVTEEAFKAYDKDADIKAAVDALTKLKGIGPAGGSLILATHDATRVVFFSDEVYMWLCDVAKKEIKYTTKEYTALVTKSQELIKKLDVDARDVEKVGFVLVSEEAENDSPGKGAAKGAAKKETPAKPEKSAEEVAARKLQLQQMAAKGRAEKVAKQAAKQAAKESKGASFRARIDAAREQAKKDGTYVVKEKPVPSGRPRGRPPGSAKRAASEIDETAAAKRPKRA